MGEVEEITMDLTETKNELNQILQEDEKDRMQLRVIEVAYIQKYGYEIGSPEANKLFPLGWFEDCDYNDKIAIIAEAIANLSDEATNPIIVMNKLTFAAFKEAQYNGTSK